MHKNLIEPLLGMLRPALFGAGQSAGPDLPASQLARKDRGIERQRQLLIVVATSIITISLLDHPFTALILGFLLAYALLAYHVPRAPLVLLPMLLPVFDFAPLTGRFFLDEFDLLILTTLVMANCRARSGPDTVRFPPAAGLLFGLFVVSSLGAACYGIGQPQWPDINAFNNYYSDFNGVRVAKALIWCVLLLPALRQELQRNAADTHRLFGLGMTLGVAATAMVVLWERTAFAGIFNFASSYRVTGPFSAMHVGGAYIEGYLVLGLPFVAWSALMHGNRLWRFACLGIFLLGSYCMMVTYARGGYIALLMTIMALVAIIPFMKTVVIKPRQAVVMILLFVVLAGVALPVLKGGFMNGRFNTSQHDLKTRAAHWMQALKLMDDSVTTTLFGMGSGRYPGLTFLTTDRTTRPATYRFANDPYNRYLQLIPGRDLYFEQIVDVRPKRQYQLRFSARSTEESAMLALPLCEKWMLYSATCFADVVKVGDTQGRWKKFTVAIDTSELDQRPWYAYRPLKLALHNVGGASIGIDNISMTSEGRELIRNGDFDQAMDHWFFSVDDFVAWHFENTWLQLYFEQGAVGLGLFVLMLVCTAIFCTGRVAEQGLPLPPLAAAMIGFLALGALDSLFDFPRLAFLFYIMLMFMLHKTPISQPQQASP